MQIKPIGSNKTELHRADGSVVLFSYQTPVAAMIAGRGYLRTEQKYSLTTSKHITQWLDGINAETVPQAELDQLVEG